MTGYRDLYAWCTAIGLDDSQLEVDASFLVVDAFGDMGGLILCRDDLDLIDERLEEAGMVLALRKKVQKAVKERLYFDEPGWEFE